MSAQSTATAIAALALLLAAPGLAQACSVCFSGEDANRWAFTITTGLLTFLPLGMIGGTAWWLWTLAKARAARERERGLVRGLPAPFPSARR